MKRKSLARAKLSDDARHMVWETLQKGEPPKELATALGSAQVMAAALEMCALESLPDFIKMVEDQRKRALQGEESAVKWLTDFLFRLKPETGAVVPRFDGLDEALARLKEHGYENI